jgi:hypothetical protein
MGLDKIDDITGTDSLQSTNSVTSFINVINLIFLLGEVKTFLLQKNESGNL